MILPLLILLHLATFISLKQTKNFVKRGENRFHLLSRCINCQSAAEGGQPEDHAWFPIRNIEDINHNNYLQAITIAEREFTVWHNPLHAADDPTRGWSVIDNVCPHRFAPLSEGRVDAKSGCIECPYHGWQFEAGTGQCTFIPQQPNLDMQMVNQNVTSVKLYPVYLTNNMLWTYLPLPRSNTSSFSSFGQLPDEINPDYNIPGLRTFTRDLPYSFDFAVENLVDPAHVPFAHHTLQGTRDDAGFIKAKQILTNETGFAYEFEDVTKGKGRQGRVKFRSPIHYSLYDNRSANSSSPNSLFREITIAVVPIQPGMSRFVMWTKPLKNRFPGHQALRHGGLNTFLESDLWVHNVELYARCGGLSSNENCGAEYEEDLLLGQRLKPVERNYSLMTLSDRPVKQFRTWWRKHLAFIPSLGPATAHRLPRLNDIQKKDRFEQHVKYCKPCLQTLKNAQQAQRWLPLVSLTIIAMAPYWYFKALGVIIFGVGMSLARFFEKQVLGMERWEPLGVAWKP